MLQAQVLSCPYVPTMPFQQEEIPSGKYLYSWPASLSLCLTCNNPEVLCKGACRKHGTTMISSNFRIHGKESWDTYWPSCGKHFEMFALGCCLASFTVMQQRCDLVYLVEVPFELQCKRKRRMGDMKCRAVAVFFVNHCIVFVFCPAVQNALMSILQRFGALTISEYALYQISRNGCKVTALSFIIPTISYALWLAQDTFLVWIVPGHFQRNISQETTIYLCQECEGAQFP